MRNRGKEREKETPSVASLSPCYGISVVCPFNHPNTVFVVAFVLFCFPIEPCSFPVGGASYHSVVLKATHIIL